MAKLPAIPSPPTPPPAVTVRLPAGGAPAPARAPAPAAAPAAAPVTEPPAIKSFAEELKDISNDELIVLFDYFRQKNITTNLTEKEREQWYLVNNELVVRGIRRPSVTATVSQQSKRSYKRCPSLPIKLGCTGELVKQIQTKLKELNYNLGPKGIDSKYGPDTRKAVIEFQKEAFPAQTKEHDGIVGEKTYGALFPAAQANATTAEEPSASAAQPETPRLTEPQAIIEPSTPSGGAVEISPGIEDTSKDTYPMKRARGLPKKPRNDVYWQSNIWTQAPPLERTDALRDILVSKGYLKERTLQESYFMQSISNRHEEVSKVVFDKLLKEIKRG